MSKSRRRNGTNYEDGSCDFSKTARRRPAARRPAQAAGSSGNSAPPVSSASASSSRNRSRRGRDFSEEASAPAEREFSQTESYDPVEDIPANYTAEQRAQHLYKEILPRRVALSAQDHANLYAYMAAYHPVKRYGKKGSGVMAMNGVWKVHIADGEDGVSQEREAMIQGEDGTFKSISPGAVQSMVAYELSTDNVTMPVGRAIVMEGSAKKHNSQAPCSSEIVNTHFALLHGLGQRVHGTKDRVETDVGRLASMAGSPKSLDLTTNVDTGHLDLENISADDVVFIKALPEQHVAQHHLVRETARIASLEEDADGNKINYAPLAGLEIYHPGLASMSAQFYVDLTATRNEMKKDAASVFDPNTLRFKRVHPRNRLGQSTGSSAESLSEAASSASHPSLNPEECPVTYTAALEGVLFVDPEQL